MSNAHNEAPEEALTADPDKTPDKRTLTFWEVFGSTFAAAIGVQSNANKVRDFTHGKFIHYVFSGLIFVACFVMVIILIVRWVLSGTIG